MADAELARLSRQIEQIEARLRRVEEVDSPNQRRLVGELHDIQRRVERMDRAGTTASEAQLGEMRRTLDRVEEAIKTKAEKKEVDDIVEDSRSNRRVVYAALVAGLVGLGSWLLQWLISRGHP